jgi:putative NADH-flavin reductase
MRVALIGATGFVGAYLLAEALTRGQLEITAVVRNVGTLPRHARLTAVSCDVHDGAALESVLRGQDAVIHAYQAPRDSADVFERGVAGHRAIIAAVKAAGVARLVVVGGAASLKTPQGVEYVDSPLWDPAFDPYKPAILATRALYHLLKEERHLDWVFVAPSVLLRPGARTGRFRSGADDVLFDAEGNSRISLEDYALALVDETVQPRHHRERFTVGY